MNETSTTVAAALTLTGITKTYPGVTALSDVSVEVAAGRVHAILGENGAGKSTLVGVAAGSGGAGGGPRGRRGAAGGPGGGRPSTPTLGINDRTPRLR